MKDSWKETLIEVGIFAAAIGGIVALVKLFSVDKTSTTNTTTHTIFDPTWEWTVEKGEEYQEDEDEDEDEFDFDLDYEESCWRSSSHAYGSRPINPVTDEYLDDDNDPDLFPSDSSLEREW